MVYPIQSSLSFVFPELEAHVDSYRKIHDPSAGYNFPPHITVLWPFLRPDRITPEILAQLGSLFGRFPKLDLQFREIGRTATGIYLRPEPREPLVEMMLAAMGAFPECTPYGNPDYSPNPHLTIALERNPHKLETLAAAFENEARAFLPFRTRATKVWLLEERGRGWERKRAFELGSAHPLPVCS
jgi:hypothetical protein